MRSLFYIIVLCAVLFPLFTLKGQSPLPPTSLSVEFGTLIAKWEAPKVALLDENFEGTGLPSGWTRSSQGIGWDTATVASLGQVPVPIRSRFMLSNDQAAGSSNNGCCDYLVTPELNLSTYPGFHLTFKSFFLGNYGQIAKVEMSTDQGNNWVLLDSLIFYPAWKTVDIDLSAYSGNGGLSSVMFAFHADDQGGQASGWAIDDVKLISENIGVESYQVSIDGIVSGSTADTSWQIDPFSLSSMGNHNFCVSAIYNNGGGSSELCTNFPGEYTPPPFNLTATTFTDSILFSWQARNTLLPLVSYGIYQDSITSTPIIAFDTNFRAYCSFGNKCIFVTAFYDLTLLGFPGEFGESSYAEICGFQNSSYSVPTLEDWASGTLETHRWTADQGWDIDQSSGNEAPSVKFTAPPGKTLYERTLKSWYYDGSWLSECNDIMFIRVAYQINNPDATANALDTLFVKVLVDDKEYVIGRYYGTNSLDWFHEDRDISSFVRNSFFQLEFIVKGLTGNSPVSWNIDNINVYWAITDWPKPFFLEAHRTGAPEDDILLTWNTDPLVAVTYVLDDNSSESQLGLEQAGELWIGNKFEVAESGKLHKAQVFMHSRPGSSAVYSIDFFDSNHNLLGSSGAFVPAENAFTQIDLPDIPFSGPFYEMIHIQSGSYSDKAGVDTNGPNALTDYGWIYDGNNWSPISAAGLNSGVVLARVSVLLEDEKTTSEISPGLSVQPVDYPIMDGSIHKNSTSSGCDTIGYCIYRRSFASYSPGNSASNTDWQWIGCVPEGMNQYLDINLDNQVENCYEYTVSILYPVGQSIPAGDAWDCIYVGLPEAQSEELSFYPNPANTYVRVDLDKTTSEICLYDITGRKCTSIKTKGESSLFLNTAAYPPGTYLLRCIDYNGAGKSRKLVIQH